MWMQMYGLIHISYYFRCVAVCACVYVCFLLRVYISTLHITYLDRHVNIRVYRYTIISSVPTKHQHQHQKTQKIQSHTYSHHTIHPQNPPHNSLTLKKIKNSPTKIKHLPLFGSFFLADFCNTFLFNNNNDTTSFPLISPSRP